MDDKKDFFSESRRDASPDVTTKERKSSKLQHTTTKHYMTPLMAKARLSEITAKLFPNEVKNRSSSSKRPSSTNKNRPSSASSVAPTVYSTVSGTSKPVSIHSTMSIASRRSATPTNKATGGNMSSTASHRHHPPFCAMIPADRIVVASSPPSSSSPLSQRGVTPPRKTSQSLLNYPYCNNDNLESKMPIFFPNDSLINLAAKMSPESHIVETKAYLPNELGKLQPIPMTMMMVPNQALLFALTHQQQQLQQEKQENSSKIALVDDDIPQVNQISFQSESINIEDNKSGSYHDDNSDTVLITTGPERSTSPSLTLSEQLTHSLRVSSQPEAAEIPSNLPSRLARRAAVKGRALLTQERLQLQRINLSKYTNPPSNKSNKRIPENQDAKGHNDMNKDPSSNFQRQSGSNPLQVALFKTAESDNKQSTNNISTTSANIAAIKATFSPIAEKAKSKQQRPVCLSPHHFISYRPLKKHAWSPSARRYDRKKHSLPSNNLDQENEDQDHASSDNEASSYNNSPDNIEESNQTSEKEQISEKSEASKSSSKSNDNNKIKVDNNQNEDDDDGLFGFGKLIQAHSKKQEQLLVKQEETRNNNESIFCLTSPIRSSITLSPNSNSNDIDNINKNNDKNAEDNEKDGCFCPLSVKERRQQYYLHSTKVLEEAIVRHQRYRKLFFLHQLRRQVHHNSHQWQLLQRGKLFHENIIRTSRVFSRWIDFTRRKQARRQRMLQSKVPLFVTKLLVSSTETIVAYLDVNKMKCSFQHWREWTKTRHPRRRKCRHILQYLTEENLFRAFKKWKRYRDDDKHQDGEKDSPSTQNKNLIVDRDESKHQKFVNPLLNDIVPSLMIISENAYGDNEREQFATSMKLTAVNKEMPKQSEDFSISIDVTSNSVLSAPTKTIAPTDVENTLNSFSLNKQVFSVSIHNKDGRKETFEGKKNASSHVSDPIGETTISPLTTASEVNKDPSELFPQEKLPSSVIAPTTISSEPTGVSPPKQIIRLNEFRQDFERSPSLLKPSSSSFSQLNQSQTQDEVSTMVVDLVDGDSSSTISTTLKPSKEYFFSTLSHYNEVLDVERYDSTRIDCNEKNSDKSLAVNHNSSLAEESAALDYPYNNNNNNPRNVGNSVNMVDIMDNIPQDVLYQQSLVLRNHDIAERKLSPSPTISDPDDDYFQPSNDPQGDDYYNASHQIEKIFLDNNVLMQSAGVENGIDRLLEMYSSRSDSLLSKKQPPQEKETAKEEKVNMDESRSPIMIKDMEDKVSAIMCSPNEVKITPISALKNEELVVDLDDNPEFYYHWNMHNVSSNNAIMNDNNQTTHENIGIYSDGNAFYNNVHYHNHLSINQNIHHFEEDAQDIVEEEDIYYDDDFEELSGDHCYDHITYPQEQYLSYKHKQNQYDTNTQSYYSPVQQEVSVSHSNNNRPEHSIFLTEADDNGYDNKNMIHSDANLQFHSNVHDMDDAQHVNFFAGSIGSHNNNANINDNQENGSFLTVVYRDMDDLDTVNHADQYNLYHGQEASLPVYEGEELPSSFENNVVLSPTMHDHRNNQSPSHYDALEDSETSFLTGRKSPFAAFQDNNLPPLPYSPYRGDIDHETDLEIDTNWNCLQENSQNKINHFPPRFPYTSDSSEHIQETSLESRCWTPFTVDELTNSNYNNKDNDDNTTKIDDKQTMVSQSQIPIQGINDEEFVDALSLKKAEEFYAVRCQKIAFYYFVKMLLLRSLQRQVMHQISVPAAVRLGLRRGLFRWNAFASLQKEKRLHKIQMLQQRATNNYQYHLNDVGKENEEDYDDEGDEYSAYMDYADDDDDVIRIIDISEL